jgi:undecaprenyl-phosphate 4-deoxy-4-formamido-L-arabinose transferase
MNVSVVIPCYRSRATLPELVSRLHAALPAVAQSYEIVLVVDGSPDDTYAVARDLEKADGRVQAVLLQRNYGQHHASLAGIARARHEITVLMDDDLQHRPEEIGSLLAPLADPLVDVVYGNAAEEEHRWWRNVTSQGIKRLLEAMGVNHARLFSSFVAFRTDLRQAFVHASGPVYVDVILSWATNSIVGVPVVMDHRTEGSSGYSLGSLIRLAWDMTTGYTTFPLRMVTGLGFLASALGVGLFCYVLVSYFTAGPGVEGWASQAAMTALFSGVIMLSLGIVGEYLGRLYGASMRRPTYLVRIHNGQGPSVGIPGVVMPQTADDEEADAVAEALRGRYAPKGR